MKVCSGISHQAGSPGVDDGRSWTEPAELHPLCERDHLGPPPGGTGRDVTVPPLAEDAQGSEEGRNRSSDCCPTRSSGEEWEQVQRGGGGGHGGVSTDSCQDPSLTGERNSKEEG